MPVFLNDRPLLDGFRRGERAALSRVYFHYVDAVAMLARCGFVIDEGRRVPGAESADVERELIQESFARAFSPKGRQGYDGLRPYRPYLLRITKNLLIDRLRRRRPELSFDDPGAERLLEEAPLGSPPEASPEEALHFGTLAQAARVFLGEASPELRELVRLRFEDDLSQEDTAAKLGISRRKVRTLEEKAQQGLKKYLQKLRLWDER